MRNLLFVSLILLGVFCSSCSVTKGYKKDGEVRLRRSQMPVLLGLSHGVEKFNMKIDFMKKHFSGMLIIKETNDNEYRIVFTSYFGLSIFDFTLTERDFKVNHCLEALNRKNVMNIFKNDFRLLFFLNLAPETEALRYYGKRENDQIFQVRSDDSDYYYFVEGIPCRLDKIITGSGLGKTQISYARAGEDMNGSVLIAHPRIGLCIELDKMK